MEGIITFGGFHPPTNKLGLINAGSTQLHCGTEKAPQLSCACMIFAQPRQCKPNQQPTSAQPAEPCKAVSLGKPQTKETLEQASAIHFETDALGLLHLRMQSVGFDIWRLDHGVGEVHLLQNDGGVNSTQGVACADGLSCQDYFSDSVLKTDPWLTSSTQRHPVAAIHNWNDVRCASSNGAS